MSRIKKLVSAALIGILAVLAAVSMTDKYSRPAAADDAVVAAIQRGTDYAAARGVTQYVFVLDRTTGQILGHTGNSWRQVGTQSLVKVPIAAYWLIRGNGSPHVAPCDMWSMITVSANDPASQCWRNDIVPEISARYGLRATINNPGAPGYWGNTRITAQDAAYMMWHMLRDPQVWPWLNEAMRNSVQDFGFNVIPNAGSKQGWGISGSEARMHTIGYTDAVVAAILQTGPSWSYGAMRDTINYTARQIHESSWQPGGIGQHFYATGARNVIGDPVSGEICNLVHGGCYKQYQRGRIYWSPATGPRTMHGAIFTRWTYTGSEWGTLGYPVTDEMCEGAKCRQDFQRGGRIYWHPQFGVAMIDGSIGYTYKYGGERLRYGFPTSEEMNTVDGWRRQNFEHGRIFWHPTKGIRIVYGGISTAYLQAGGEQVLGLPLDEERCSNGRCQQQFEKGRIYWGDGIRVEIDKPTPAPTPAPAKTTSSAQPSSATSAPVDVDSGGVLEDDRFYSPSPSQSVVIPSPTSAVPSAGSSSAVATSPKATNTANSVASESAISVFSPTASTSAPR